MFYLIYEILFNTLINNNFTKIWSEKNETKNKLKNNNKIKKWALLLGLWNSYKMKTSNKLKD